MTLPAGTDPRIQQELDKLRRESQTVQHKTFDRVPLLKEVAPGGVVVARISGTSYLYSRVGDQLSRVAMTDV